MAMNNLVRTLLSTAIASLALINICIASDAPAKTRWPQLVGGKGIEECTSAYAVARAAFMASNPELVPPTPDAKNLALDDTEKFEAIDRPYLPSIGDNSFRTLYWGRFITSGQRIVLRVNPLGWQYESVSAYVLDEKITLEAFIEDIRKSEVGHERFPPFIREKADLIVVLSGENQLWVADMGLFNASLPDWEVFTIKSSGALHNCSIQFRPKHKKISNLLPPEVSQYVSLLGMTLGDGSNEGSLQQTRRIRAEVESTIANIAVRPWALSDPYNSAAEVENGLRVWASQKKWNSQHYQKIKRAYAPALRALQKYYKISLQLSVQKANSAALASMDTLLRAHYAFHKDE